MFPEISEIRGWRRRLGLNQSALARGAGISQSAVAKIEKGRINPSYSTMRRIIEFLREEEKGKETTAKDMMNPRIIKIDKNDTVGIAIKLMRHHDVSQIPVFSEEKLVGNISEKTIVDHLSKNSDLRELSKIPVEKIMEEPFPIVDESTPFSVISSILQHANAILICRKEKLVGIITKADLLKAVRR